MIAKDLIEKLGTFNPDTEVFIPEGDQLVCRVRYVEECLDDDKENETIIVIHGY